MTHTCGNSLACQAGQVPGGDRVHLHQNLGRIEVGGNAQNEAFIDDDAIGVATIGDTSKMLIWGVEGEGLVRTELFKTSFAEACRLMLGQNLDVTSAAYRVGYDDASHFNPEYKRLFGAPPMRDVERLRECQVSR